MASPSHRGGNWGIVARKRSHSQFGGREITGTLSSWCKTRACTGLHHHRGQRACPSRSSDCRSYLRGGKGKGRRWPTVCRYEGKGSLVKKPGSRYDNNNMPRPSEPLVKREGTPGRKFWLRPSFCFLIFQTRVFFLFPETFYQHLWVAKCIFTMSFLSIENLKNNINLIPLLIKHS